MCDYLTKHQRACLLRDNALEAEKALRHDAEEAFRAFELGEDTFANGLALLEDAQLAAHEAEEYGKLAEKYLKEEQA